MNVTDSCVIKEKFVRYQLGEIWPDNKRSCATLSSWPWSLRLKDKWKLGSPCTFVTILSSVWAGGSLEYLLMLLLLTAAQVVWKCGKFKRGLTQFRATLYTGLTSSTRSRSGCAFEWTSVNTAWLLYIWPSSVDLPQTSTIDLLAMGS